MTDDGCLQRSKGRIKRASAMVYLMEELGDARLRCDQLIRYLAEAAKLIEKSPYKDHFFEVAGHLIHGAPDAAFRLQKALAAVALAAGQIDHEELKRELRPEKVRELEEVLDDVRIRQVRRWAQPLTDLTRKEAADKLRELAATYQEFGLFPRVEMAQLVQALEGESKTASQPDLVDGLGKLADAVENTSEEDAPSRALLAATLRRMLGDTCVEELRGEGQIMATAAEWKQTEDGGRQHRGGPPEQQKQDGTGPEGKGPPGRGQGPCKQATPIVNQVVAAAQKEARGSTSRAITASRQVVVAAKTLAEAAKTKDISPMHHAAMGVLDALGMVLKAMGQPGGQRLLIQTQNKLRGFTYAGMEDDEGPVTVEASAWKKKAIPPGIASDDEEKSSRFEEGKPADKDKDGVPDNITDPKAKAEWKKQNELNKDKFKAASRFVPIEKAQKGDMVEIEVGTPWPRPNSPQKEKVTGKVVRVKKDGVVTVDVERSRSNPGGHSNEDVAYVDVRLASATSRAWKVGADDEEKSSRFEEGKPADKDKDGVPDNITDPKAKAEWKKQNELNKDKFKAAADERRPPRVVSPMTRASKADWKAR